VPVKGKVVSADGKPVKGMVMSFHPDDELTKSARLQSALLPADGSFAVECLPGRYKVTLGPLPKSAGDAPAAGPGSVPAPTPNPTAAPNDPTARLLARLADHTQTPLEVTVPAGGTSDLVLTVK
jgi:hypothetical protein